MATDSPIIRIHELSKIFPTPKGPLKVLDNVEITIEQGEIFGVIGMSGAGKSTLVRCINFLERPTSGTIYFDGKDLSRMSKKEINHVRHSMGMIFQQFNLLMQRTSLENVCFPLEITGVDRPSARKRASELLELVELSEKADSYPSQLSGGQRQRVAIARALATNPRVLLCDEATSALDPATTREVLSLLRNINEKLGITIVIITHEMSVIEEICHRVAIIDASRIAEIGNVSDVFTSPQSAVARRLVFPEGKKIAGVLGKRTCRIVFEGNDSFEPVIANMVLKFGHPVNIMFADTNNIEGKAFGQIVVQLPEDQRVASQMMNYVRSLGLTVEEVDGYVD